MKYIALCFILCFSSFSILADEQPKETVINSFGITLGQPLTELKISKVRGHDSYIEPQTPSSAFFDSYIVNETPDNTVYKVTAMGTVAGKFSCEEATAFLDAQFVEKYDMSFFKRAKGKGGEYLYMNDSVVASIMCTGDILTYSYKYLKDLKEFPSTLNKFKDIKSNI